MEEQGITMSVLMLSHYSDLVQNIVTVKEKEKKLHVGLPMVLQNISLKATVQIQYFHATYICYILYFIYILQLSINSVTAIKHYSSS